MAQEPEGWREPVDDSVDDTDTRPAAPNVRGDRDPATPDPGGPVAAWSADEDEDEDEVFSFALGGSERAPVESSRFGLRTNALADGARDELDAMAAADALAALDAVPTSPAPTATDDWTRSTGTRSEVDDDALDDHLAWALDKARETSTAPDPTHVSTTSDEGDDAVEGDEPATFSVGTPSLDDEPASFSVEAPALDDEPATFSVDTPAGDDEPPTDEPDGDEPPAGEPASSPPLPAAPPPVQPPLATSPSPEADAPSVPPAETALAAEQHTAADDGDAHAVVAMDVTEEAVRRPAHLASIWDVADDDAPSAWDAFATGELEGREAAWDESTVRPGGLPKRDWEVLATAGSGEVDVAKWASFEAAATPQAPDDDDWETAVDAGSWPDHGTLATASPDEDEDEDDEIEAFLMQISDEMPVDEPTTQEPTDEDEPTTTWTFGTYGDDEVDDGDLDAAWERASTTSASRHQDLAPVTASGDDEGEGLDDEFVFSFSVDDDEDGEPSARAADVDSFRDADVDPFRDADVDSFRDADVESFRDADVESDRDTAPAGPSVAPISDDAFSALLESTAGPSALEGAARLAIEMLGDSDAASDGIAPGAPTHGDDVVLGSVSDEVGDLGAMAQLDTFEGLDSLDGLDGLGGLGGLGDLDLDWLDEDDDAGSPAPPPPPAAAAGPPPPPPTRPEDTPAASEQSDDAVLDDEAVDSPPGPIDLGNFSAGSSGGRRRRGLFGR